MGYCWIKRKKLYDTDDVQHMLEFLKAKEEMEECRLFLNRVERLSQRDANSIYRVMRECNAESFDRYDSDVAEQFVNIFDSMFVANSRYNNHTALERFVVVGLKTTEAEWKWGILDTVDWTVEDCTERQIFDLVIVHRERVDGVRIIKNPDGSQRLEITVQ